MNNRPHAVFITNLGEKNINYVYTQKQQQELAELADFVPGIITEDSLDSVDLTQVEVAFSTWGMPSLTEEQLAKYLPNLKAVFYAAGATDTFARPLFARNIRLASAWRANAMPVAEFTLAQIILSMKNYFSNIAHCIPENIGKEHPLGPGCYGETVALIGAGAISTRLQELLRPFSLNVIVIPSRAERRTISLEEAFKTAYVVSNHLPDRDDNKKVLTRELFASMRHGATFINTGRGAQVDEEGLAAVLRERSDLTALLDVTFPEPPEARSPLYSLPNVHLSSHIAGSVNDEVHRMADWMICEFKHYINGEPWQHELNETMLLTHS